MAESGSRRSGMSKSVSVIIISSSSSSSGSSSMVVIINIGIIISSSSSSWCCDCYLYRTSTPLWPTARGSSLLRHRVETC